MGTHHQGNVREVKVLNAFIKMARALKAIGDRNEGRLAEAGLTETQFGILEALHHLGALRASDLGEKVLTSSANVTVLTDALTRKGLVKRRRCESDKRVVYVELTAKGHEVIERVFPDHLSGLLEDFAPLSDEELEVLAHLAKKVGVHTASLLRSLEGLRASH
jgi:MarR family 2-MHQ and catechol resistance regulon transcriptional repressor